MASSAVHKATIRAMIPASRNYNIAAGPACPEAMPGKTKIPAPTMIPAPILIAALSESVLDKDDLFLLVLLKTMDIGQNYE